MRGTRHHSHDTFMHSYASVWLPQSEGEDFSEKLLRLIFSSNFFEISSSFNWEQLGYVDGTWFTLIMSMKRKHQNDDEMLPLLTDKSESKPKRKKTASDEVEIERRSKRSMRAARWIPLCRSKLKVRMCSVVFSCCVFQPALSISAM